MRIAYSTKFGKLIHGTAEEALDSKILKNVLGKVDLVFTSPPFPLNRKKKYGNLQGQAYINWLAGFAQPLRRLLKPRGSIVMEVGNAWEPRRPIMSTLALRALLAFLDKGELRLCQQFIYYNPARLPAPAHGRKGSSTIKIGGLSAAATPWLPLNLDCPQHQEYGDSVEGEMPMPITIQPEHERLIAEALMSGAYQNPNEVIQRALELLRDRDAWLAENRARIDEGYAAAQRGELIDADQVRVQMEEKKRAWRAEQRKA